MTSIFFDRASHAEDTAALEALSCPPGCAVFGIDLSAPLEAVSELIAARRDGKTCAVYALLPDPLEQTLSLIAQSIAANDAREKRFEHLNALRSDQLRVNEKRPAELAEVPAAHLHAGALVLRLADVILTAAPGDRDRWNHLYGRFFRRFSLLPVPPGPPGSITNEGGVTIYAPATAAAALTLHVSVLEQLGIKPRVVSAENPTDPVCTRVVVTPEWRAMRSRTLAAAGHNVVAPNPFRLDECDARIFGFHPVDYRSMLGAVDAALSSVSTTNRIPLTIESVRASIEAEAPVVTRGPRVSIIVRTFDRPALLERAIASVARQSYRDVEIVVVNNGGADVRGLVERASQGRPFVYERMGERKTISAASNVGARASTGTYVGYLDDDDLLYADHCARAIEVLERTKADLVYTLCVAEYARMYGDEKHVLGYQIYLDRQYHPDDIFVANVTPIHTVVHRRSLFDRFGFFDDRLPVTDDWEFWLRLATEGARFVRIDRATCEYSWRYDPDRGNMTVEHQWDFVHAYEEITKRYAHLIPDRSSLHAQQATMLAEQRRRAEDAADPAKRASIVISSMTSTTVPVAPRWESERLL